VSRGGSSSRTLGITSRVRCSLDVASSSLNRDRSRSAFRKPPCSTLVMVLAEHHGVDIAKQKLTAVTTGVNVDAPAFSATFRKEDMSVPVGQAQPVSPEESVRQWPSSSR
jgi:hypothetical protein